MRENAAAKGRRLLTEGRLRVLEVGAGTARAECRGDSGMTYVVGRDKSGHWACSCEAKGRCSHLIALMLVVALEPSTNQDEAWWR
jgi:uncharacterized Zn finger protein